MVETSPSRTESLIAYARDLAAQNPSWVEFHRALLGPGGEVERVFPSRDARADFLQSYGGRELVALMAALRQRSDRRPKHGPSITVTVRLPKSVHEALVREAADEHLSLHRLCLAKLARPLGETAAPLPDSRQRV